MYRDIGKMSLYPCCPYMRVSSKMHFRYTNITVSDKNTDEHVFGQTHIGRNNTFTILHAATINE